jgi:hypothetical protein
MSADPHNTHNPQDLISFQRPFFIGRIAGIELQVAYDLHHNRRLTPTALHEIVNNAGIHTESEESLVEYTKQLCQAYDHCTAIAIWDKSGPVYAATGHAQEWILQRTKVPTIQARALEPYYEADSWMSAMNGKRVLIIHPFYHSIQRQLPRLAALFPNRPWFPSCQIEVVVPPMTCAGNHGGKDWQVHLAAFYETMEKKEFDIALVAAGGYGMIIADMIYTRLHRSVMYVGGALQLFFGIIGRRWFDQKEILMLMNDEWIRPLKEDQPLHHVRVEKGCYW